MTFLSQYVAQSRPGRKVRSDDTQRIHRRTGELESVAPGPRDRAVLTVLRGPNPGFIFALNNTPVIMGRGGEAQVMISDEGLSRRHARIARVDHGYQIEDLGSTNGTYVNGQRVRQAHGLQDGDRIELGCATLLRFALHDAVEHEAARRTHELTIQDPLTRLINRRHLQDRLSGEIAYANRHHAPLAVLLVDVDQFKRINDEHGHGAGDAVLRAIAGVLATVVREEDVVARYGGEEFIVLARGIGNRGAHAFGERLREAIARLVVPVQGTVIRVTASVGVACTSGDDSCSAESLVRAADDALYAAKGAGRNRVESSVPRPAKRTGERTRDRRASDRPSTRPKTG